MQNRKRVRCCSAAERRELQRMPLHHVVQVESASGSGSEPAVLINVTADGALFVSDKYYRPGSGIGVHVTLTSPAATARLLLAGRVLRCGKSQDGCTVAVSFDEHAFQLLEPQQASTAEMAA